MYSHIYTDTKGEGNERERVGKRERERERDRARDEQRDREGGWRGKEGAAGEKRVSG